MSSSDLAFLRKLAEIKRSGHKISMDQLRCVLIVVVVVVAATELYKNNNPINSRRLDHIKQGQFTVAVAEDEEPMPPKFLTDIQDAEVTRQPDCPLMIEYDRLFRNIS